MYEISIQPRLFGSFASWQKNKKLNLLRIINHLVINKINCVYLHSDCIIPINYRRILLKPILLVVSAVKLNLFDHKTLIYRILHFLFLEKKEGVTSQEMRNNAVRMGLLYFNFKRC